MVEVLVIDDPIAACEEALRQAGADTRFWWRMIYVVRLVINPSASQWR